MKVRKRTILKWMGSLYAGSTRQRYSQGKRQARALLHCPVES